MKQLSYKGRDLEAMSFAKNYYRWVADEFSQFLDGRVAEIGAGSGNFSSLILGKKIEKLVAIEPSQEMYPLLRDKFYTDNRVLCRQAIFTDIYKEYSYYFDSMVYVNVLEHIENDKQELFYINQSLKNGGYVCIFVPALAWLYSDFDASVGHYRRYYKKQLIDLVEKAGFEIVKISYFDIMGIIPWFIFFKIFKKKLTANDAALYDKIVIPVLRAIESFLPIPTGKNLILVAKKHTKLE